MSAENVGRQLNNIVSQDDGAIITVDGDIVLAAGLVFPADTAVGYATGCLFLHLDGGNATSLYVNEGDADSSDFNAIIVA